MFDKEFRYSGATIEETTGEAEPLNDAVGRIAMNFARLEEEVSSAITFLLKVSTKKGHLVTCEMSFKAKLNVMASLMRLEHESGNLRSSVPDSNFGALLYMCNKSEELRNKLLHSSWVYDHTRNEIRRRKLSAKSRRGFVHEEEPLMAGQVLDIADYIIYTAMSVEEFFLHMFPGYRSSFVSVL